MTVPRPASRPPDEPSKAPPPTHRLEAIALDQLATTLATLERGSLVLLYGASGEDCDRAAAIGANVFAYERRAAMAADPGLRPAVVVDAPFDRGSVLDLRVLFATIQARLGAPEPSRQVATAALPAAGALWARGRRQQLREYADSFLAAVNACQGRGVEAVFVTHLARRGERPAAGAPGEGTETLAQFAAAAGVRLVLSGGYEVLDYRTTAAPVAEIHFPRYRPAAETDRAEFARVAGLELERLGAADLVAKTDVVDFLFAHTLGSVALLRGLVERAVELGARLPGGYTTEDILFHAAGTRPAALKAAAQRIVTVERRLAAEGAVGVDDVFAILAGPERDPLALAGEAVEAGAPLAKGRPNYRDPQTRRPGERSLVHDPVGVTDDRVA